MPGFPLGAVATLPRRDLVTIAGSLTAVALLAWLYLFSLAADMSGDMGMAMMAAPRWTPAYFFMMFLMWSIMMVAMMLPSVMPTVMIYRLIARKAANENRPVRATGVFVAGYIVVWNGFSLLATLGQLFLDNTALISPMMVVENPYLVGTLLIVAGAWQLSPLKEQCLEHCRSPVTFISTHWRKGALGAAMLGFRHGLFCLGCCWAIMALLFVGGVMNLLWIALLSVYVLAEKLLPMGRNGGRYAGYVLLFAGALFIMS